jgi:hypothetical protein
LRRRGDIKVVEEPLVVGADNGRPLEHLMHGRRGVVAFPARHGAITDANPFSDHQLDYPIEPTDKYDFVDIGHESN